MKKGPPVGGPFSLHQAEACVRLVRKRPAAIAVFASGAIGRFSLTVDNNGLTVLTANATGRRVHAFTDRGDRTAVAGLRVVPVDRLVQRCAVRLVNGAVVIFHVRAVERFTDRAAHEGADQRASAGRPQTATTAAQCRTCKTAQNRTAGRTDRLLGAHTPRLLGAILSASAERQRAGKNQCHNTFFHLDVAFL